jgi:hypothetical protein
MWRRWQLLQAAAANDARCLLPHPRPHPSNSPRIGSSCQHQPLCRMWSIVTSAPSLALGCAVLVALCIRRLRRGCNLSAFWFIVCLTAKALRPRPPTPPSSSSPSPPPPPPTLPPPEVTRGRESMRRLIRLAAPLMSFAPQPPSLRRSQASIAGVGVRWYDVTPSHNKKL